MGQRTSAALAWAVGRGPLTSMVLGPLTSMVLRSDSDGRLRAAQPDLQHPSFKVALYCGPTPSLGEPLLERDQP